MTNGNGNCSKRYLRGPERKRIGQEINEKKICPSIYRNQEANRLMEEGDSEAPHL